MQDMACGLCGKQFMQEDVVPLNGTAEQVQDLRQQLDCRRASKGGSKAKKRRLNTADAAD